MSEYFRKYIKKEHYPVAPYTHAYSDRISSSRPPSGTVSIRV